MRAAKAAESDIGHSTLCSAAFVHRDVVGFVALDLVPRVIRARLVLITLVAGALLVHLDDFAADVASSEFQRT